MKQFDDRLSENIRKSFEDYEASYNPAHWDLMKQKLKSKKKRSLLLLPFWAKAAIITLLFTSSITTYLYFNELSTKQYQYGYLQIDSINHHINKKRITKQSKLNNNKQNITKQYNTSENNKIKNTQEANTTETLLKYNQFKNEQNIKNRISISDLSNVSIEQDCTIIQADNLIINKDKKRMKFGAMLATYSSTPSMSVSNQQGVGLGFNSEIALNEKISLNTGIVLASQRFDFDPNAGSNTEYDMVMDAGNELNSTNSINKDGSAKIVALDIPINMQFKLYEKKRSSFYCAVGISSYAYLKQQYETVNYNYSNTMYYDESKDEYTNQLTVNSSNVSEKEPAFNHFDLAKVINLSISYKYKLKKGELAFEPYIKYPYRPLTSQAINVSFAGLNLKYNF